MNEVEKRQACYQLYGLTPEQFHVGLDKLWKALGRFVDDVPNEEGFSDIFSLCAAELMRLREENRRLKESELYVKVAQMLYGEEKKNAG